MPDLPHVTEIIKAAGLMNESQWIDPYYMELGTAAHLATQFYDEGDLDEESLAPEVRPRLEAYKQFTAEVRPAIASSELRVVSPLGYCGRLDRIVEIGSRLGVLDIKGPTQAPWQGVQLSAYAHCLGPDSQTRWSLHLSDTGYKLIEHKSRDDWPAFQAALSLWHWKRNHGCLKSS